jgi:hypothetical protein
MPGMKPSSAAAANSHIWIPIIIVDTNLPDPEQVRGEECRLCGTYRKGATPDPPEAALSCPFPPPTLPELTKEELESGELMIKCRVCGVADTPGGWDFSGKFCPHCGSRHGAIRA